MVTTTDKSVEGFRQINWVLFVHNIYLVSR